MDNTFDSSISKMLVDAVISKLQDLSEKINSYHTSSSALEKNTDNMIKEINQILFETKNITKTLGDNLDNFYNGMNSIANVTKSIEEKIDTVIQKVDTVATCTAEIKEKVHPVGKLSTLLSTPIGIIITIISFISVVMGVCSCQDWIKQKIFGVQPPAITQKCD